MNRDNRDKKTEYIKVSRAMTLNVVGGGRSANEPSTSSGVSRPLASEPKIRPAKAAHVPGAVLLEDISQLANLSKRVPLTTTASGRSLAVNGTAPGVSATPPGGPVVSRLNKAGSSTLDRGLGDPTVLGAEASEIGLLAGFWQPTPLAPNQPPVLSQHQNATVVSAAAQLLKTHRHSQSNTQPQQQAAHAAASASPGNIRSGLAQPSRAARRPSEDQAGSLNLTPSSVHINTPSHQPSPHQPSPQTLSKARSVNYGRPPSNPHNAIGAPSVQRSASHSSSYYDSGLARTPTRDGVNPGYVNREPTNAIVMPHSEPDLILLERSGPDGQARLLSSRQGGRIDEESQYDRPRSRAQGMPPPSPPMGSQRPPSRRLEEHEVMQHFNLVRVRSATKGSSSHQSALWPPQVSGDADDRTGGFDGWSNAESSGQNSPLRQPFEGRGVVMSTTSGSPSPNRMPTAAVAVMAAEASSKTQRAGSASHPQRRDGAPHRQGTAPHGSSRQLNAKAEAGRNAVPAGPVFGGTVMHAGHFANNGHPPPQAANWRRATNDHGSMDHGSASPPRFANANINPLTHAAQTRAAAAAQNGSASAAIYAAMNFAPSHAEGSDPSSPSFRANLDLSNNNPYARSLATLGPSDMVGPSATIYPRTSREVAQASTPTSSMSTGTQAAAPSPSPAPALSPLPPSKPVPPRPLKSAAAGTTGLQLSGVNADNRPLKEVLNDIAAGKYNRTREIRDVVLFDAEFAAWDDQPGSSLLRQGWTPNDPASKPQGGKAGQEKRYKPKMVFNGRHMVQGASRNRTGGFPGDEEGDGEDSGLEEEEEEEEE